MLLCKKYDLENDGFMFIVIDKSTKMSHFIPSKISDTFRIAFFDKVVKLYPF